MNTLLRICLTFSGSLVLCGPAYSAEPVEVHWNDFCRVTEGRQLEITTDTGDTITGYCIRINADEVQVRQRAKIAKLGRKALAQITVDRSEGRQLQKLSHGIRTGLRNGFKWLLSPQAIEGIVTIPATLAWGAISAPFCAIGDLKHLAEGARQIKLI